jgi:hypothetical protein
LLTFSFNGAVLHGYIDGVRKISVNAPGNIDGNDSVLIGSSFQGSIDDVRIYARALTAQEVRQQYLTGVQKLYANGAIDETEYAERLLALEGE